MNVVPKGDLSQLRRDSINSKYNKTIEKTIQININNTKNTNEVHDSGHIGLANILLLPVAVKNTQYQYFH